jgi:hypothetical protein
MTKPRKKPRKFHGTLPNSWSVLTEKFRAIMDPRLSLTLSLERLSRCSRLEIKIEILRRFTPGFRAWSDTLLREMKFDS